VVSGVVTLAVLGGLGYYFLTQQVGRAGQGHKPRLARLGQRVTRVVYSMD
jgi:hypothetical protein